MQKAITAGTVIRGTIRPAEYRAAMECAMVAMRNCKTAMENFAKQLEIVIRPKR